MTVTLLIKYVNEKKDFSPASATVAVLIIKPTDMHSYLNKM